MLVVWSVKCERLFFRLLLLLSSNRRRSNKFLNVIFFKEDYKTKPSSLQYQVVHLCYITTSFALGKRKRREKTRKGNWRVYPKNIFHK